MELQGLQMRDPSGKIGAPLFINDWFYKWKSILEWSPEEDRYGPIVCFLQMDGLR